MTRAAAWTLLLALTSQALPVRAQSGQPLIDQTLAVDVNTSTDVVAGSSNPTYIGTIGGDVYFSADNDGAVRTVYVTDGTTSGTASAQAGQSGPIVVDLAEAVNLPGDRILARGRLQSTGYELVGFGAGFDGIELIADIWPGAPVLLLGAGSSFPTRLTEWNGEAWFYADDGVHGNEIWRSDGTAAGTRLAFDLNPGAPGIVDGNGSIGVAGGKLFFSSRNPERTLWALDTPDGTPIPLITSDATFPSSLVQMAQIGNELFFDWDMEATGDELWRSDGTVAGTVPLEINPGELDGQPWFLASDGSTLWFNASTPATGRELWISDGTEAGTQLVLDTAPGPSNGMQNTRGGIVGGKFVFSRPDVGIERVLWSSDGTAGGTAPLTDANGETVGIANDFFFEWQGGVWFNGATDATGDELFSTDGTSAGTAIAADLEPGSDGSAVRVLGAGPGFLLTGADVGVDGYEPWISDGTQAGSSLLVDFVIDPLNEGSNPIYLQRLRDVVVFNGSTPEFGRELYASDGTPEGTVLLADVRPGPETSFPQPLTEIDAGLLFSVLPDFTGREIWITDGTPEGTRQVGVFDDGFSFQGVDAQRLADGLAYFNAPDGQGNIIWRTDGTPEGTEPVAGYTVIPSFKQENEAQMIDGVWLFGAEGPEGLGTELWRTDGSPDGTRFIADLNPGFSSSAPRHFTRLGDRTVFAAYTADLTDELWVSDGTATGTQVLTDLIPTGTFGGPILLTPLGDRVVFRIDDVVHGSELWITDGTEAGTQLVIDLVPGPQGSSPFSFEVVGDELYFWAVLANGDYALHRTDGTAAGTVLIVDDAGPFAEFDSNHPLTAVGDSVLFPAPATAVGRELWISDGTPAGTMVLSDIAKGQKDSFPLNFVPYGDRVLFTAFDIEFGVELHAIPLTTLELWSATEVGLGCGADLRASGSAAFGATLELESASSAPFSPAAVFFGAELAATPLGPDCLLHLVDPLLLASLTTDAEGLAQASLTIPSDPNLAGLPLLFQSLAVAPGGGFLDVFELSNALEVVAVP